VKHDGNSERISKIVETTPIKDDRTGRLNISKTGLNTAQEGNEFGKPTRIACKNEETEMAFHGYLRKRRFDLYRDGVSGSICFGLMC
jgi:hypothetical protein